MNPVRKSKPQAVLRAPLRCQLLIASQDGQAVLQVGNARLVFNEQIGLPSLLRFAAQVVSEQSAELDQELSNLATRGLQHVGQGFIRGLVALDGTYLDARAVQTLRITREFSGMFKRFFEAMADRSGEQFRVQIDFFDLAWRNPPRILKFLGEALKSSWEVERIDPLKTYFEEFGGRWQELAAIIRAWNEWSGTLATPTRDSLLSGLATQASRHPEELAYPRELSEQALSRWTLNWGQFLSDEFESVIAADFQSGQNGLSSDQLSSGLALAARTRQWYTENFWPIQVRLVTPPSSGNSQP